LVLDIRTSKIGMISAQGPGAILAGFVRAAPTTLEKSIASIR